MNFIGNVFSRYCSVIDIIPVNEGLKTFLLIKGVRASTFYSGIASLARSQADKPPEAMAEVDDFFNPNT